MAEAEIAQAIKPSIAHFCFMRKALAILLIITLVSQSMSNWLTLAVFRINQAWIARNSCENRFRPKMNCKGNCVLMKKWKQQEKEEQPAPGKAEISSFVISSKSYFRIDTSPLCFLLKATVNLFIPTKPVDRSFAFFHPPQKA